MTEDKMMDLMEGLAIVPSRREMTKKQGVACLATIKMWKWLAKHPNGQKSDYFRTFPEERMKLPDIRCGDAIKDECFLYSAFNCGCDSSVFSCPLGHCGAGSVFESWLTTRSPEYALMIVDLVQDALYEAAGCDWYCLPNISGPKKIWVVGHTASKYLYEMKEYEKQENKRIKKRCEAAQKLLRRPGLKAWRGQADGGK